MLFRSNKAGEKYTPSQVVLDVEHLQEGVAIQSKTFDHEGKNYWLLNVLGSPVVPEGKYLYNPATSKVEMQWTQGIGGPDAAAPQARLMSVVINGILTRKLPWGLVLLGVFLVIAVELLGIRSLAFAVGSYLSIATTLAIFSGGVVRWLVDQSLGQKQRHGDVGNNYIGPKLLCRIDECTPVVHDTNQFETLLEESLKALRNHHMVVREENSRPWHTPHPMVPLS